MEKFRPQSEMLYRALEPGKEKDPLAKFTPEQQAEIKQKQQILSSLAYFIGKDFRIPVELNEPEAGWSWNFEENVIRVDPKDLLEKPMDYLRFLISHEGGHRRISRTEFIPLKEWNQPGFSFMMNAVEDPRDNNFVAESYPKFREQMKLAHTLDLDFEVKAKQKADQKLGYQPRFMQAGFEYIKQWFRETEGKEAELSKDLPEEVSAVVSSTLAAARDSWWRYPSREEADNGGKAGGKKVNGETMIKEYAKISYEINRDKIWPEFKKLVEADMKDQKMQEFLKDLQKGEKGGEQGLPQELKEKLTPDEEQLLGEAQRKPINLGSLPQELKQKIKEFIESLPEEQKKEIAEKAQAAFKEFEKSLNEELEGKLANNPEKKAEREEQEKEKPGTQPPRGEPVRTGILPKEPLDSENLRIYRERLKREMNKDENLYEQSRREVLPLIEKLEADLRQILIDKTVTAWKGGFKGGKRIDIKKRIQEKAKAVPAMESHAWQRRERPDEKDYAISLLIDLSGSMREKFGKNRKIDETFKTAVVLAEALNRLGLNLEVMGFNDEAYEYQNFGQPMSREIREHMGGMFKEVEDSCCKSCGNEHSETDLGWATKLAAERLAAQKSAKKLLVVLTDGKFAESSKHPRQEFNPEKIKQNIIQQTDIVPLDLGSIAGKTVEQVIEELKGLIGKNL